MTPDTKSSLAIGATVGVFITVATWLPWLFAYTVGMVALGILAVRGVRWFAAWNRRRRAWRDTSPHGRWVSPEWIAEMRSAKGSVPFDISWDEDGAA